MGGNRAEECGETRVEGGGSKGREEKANHRRCGEEQKGRRGGETKGGHQSPGRAVRAAGESRKGT